MDNELSFYKYYHQNPINKWIHFFCIPLIVLSIIVLLNDFYILNERYNKKLNKIDRIWKYKMSNLIIILYVISYSTISLKIGIVMFIYFMILKCLSNFLLLRIKNNLIPIIMFAVGWILQFIGHFIEGRRPALIDSIFQAFFQAPLFSLEVLFPNLFE